MNYFGVLGVIFVYLYFCLLGKFKSNYAYTCYFVWGYLEVLGRDMMGGLMGRGNVDGRLAQWILSSEVGILS